MPLNRPARSLTYMDSANLTSDISHLTPMVAERCCHLYAVAKSHVKLCFGSVGCNLFTSKRTLSHAHKFPSVIYYLQGIPGGDGIIFYSHRYHVSGILDIVLQGRSSQILSFLSLRLWFAQPWFWCGCTRHLFLRRLLKCFLHSFLTHFFFS